MLDSAHIQEKDAEFLRRLRDKGYTVTMPAAGDRLAL